MLTEIKKKHSFLSQGPINPQLITDSIVKHSSKKNIGAHEIFLGQVRADVVNGKNICAIDYSAYAEMAEIEIEKIRENIIVKHQLTCAHVKHSLGKIAAGEICFFVFVSSPHRQAAFDACYEMVDLIKKDVPIFGKEIFEDASYQWKENKI
ncbi:MAG TPA: molybdenum cofactor biosynthesis protein MoaE [Bacteroidia bacterium]|nr:molybdenum cofactor biosynthesis protein MoaE [Bacteroidia bacterium]